MIGVFDRSHYEDVLAVRVRKLADRARWTRRYDAINRFEAELAAGGTTVIKCFLHISREEQRERLLARLDDPTKHWKFNPRDIDDRALWDDYMTAYDDALGRCNTDTAPWHIIPPTASGTATGRSRSCFSSTSRRSTSHWPPAAFDVEEQRRRVLSIP